MLCIQHVGTQLGAFMLIIIKNQKVELIDSHNVQQWIVNGP